MGLFKISIAKSKPTRFFVGFIIVAVLVGFGAAGGLLIANKLNYNRTNDFPLLDPSVSQPNVHQEIINFDPLRQNLKQYFASLNTSHSFYFEYLSNGASIRDGADQTSVAASLMKVPVVMDLYKLSEAGKLNLDQPVTVKQSEINTDSDYGDTTKLKAGDSLTLRKAAQITLQNSDNTTLNIIKDKALPLLTDNTDAIQSLDISFTVTGDDPGNEQANISARSYSSVLKCLYYSCFLQAGDSQQLLGYLLGSVEQNRLMAGVGQGIGVAHKVGSSSNSQSDCGIIYYPGKPYLVCLMFFGSTVGNTNDDGYFQHVSQMVYDYVASSGTN